MAITDTINLMKTNITNAYSAIEAKGGAEIRVAVSQNMGMLAGVYQSIGVNYNVSVEATGIECYTTMTMVNTVTGASATYTYQKTFS